jgi:hypothetical protein
VNRVDRLKAALRRRNAGPLPKTPASREIRAEVRDRLNAEIRDHGRAAARWEAQEDPAVLEFRRRRVGNAVAEQEARARLRKEQPAPEPRSPALQALGRSEAERLSDMAWAESDGQAREGWFGS